MPALVINILLVVSALVFLAVIVGTVISRYRMCPPDKILVVYGKVGGESASRCYNGGSTFVLPVFQNYAYLDLAPIPIEIPLRGALSKQNIRINAPANFTVAVSNNPEFTGNAATRLLGKQPAEIAEIAKEIITGQMRVVIASMTIEEINSDREKLIMEISKGVEVELHKIGLQLINCNITDITDESGYIDALGKEAAAKAINDAQIKVAQENQRGSIGKAEAEREQAIRVSEAHAAAAIGTNKAQQQIINSQAELSEKQAEGDRRREVAEKTAAAQAQKAAFEAQRETEEARLARDEAAAKATQLAKANADKETLRVNAEAAAAQARIQAEGRAAAARIEAEGAAAASVATAQAEAKGIAAKLLAEAEGKQAILNAQAEGLRAFSNTESAIHLIVAQQLVQLATIQASAIKELKFDKVVMLGGAQGGGPGALVQDLFKGVLPVHEVAKAAGIRLPDFLGKPESDKI
jgi:flotillin